VCEGGRWFGSTVRCIGIELRDGREDRHLSAGSPPRADLVGDRPGDSSHSLWTSATGTNRSSPCRASTPDGDRAYARRAEGRLLLQATGPWQAQLPRDLCWPVPRHSHREVLLGLAALRRIRTRYGTRCAEELVEGDTNPCSAC